MLKKILDPSVCGGCRICCVFDRDDIWEIPCVDASLAAKLKREYGEEIKLVKNEETGSYTFGMEFGGDGLSECPMLGIAGCRLGENKPFCCKIWPFRVMRRGNRIALTLSRLCGAVNALGDAKIKEFVAGGFGDAVFAYAYKHPEIVKPFYDGYDVIEERPAPAKGCCFTGHRPGKFPFGNDESSEAFADFRNSLNGAIKKAYDGGCRRFSVGMAEGFDIWSAEAVLEMRKDTDITLCAVIPYRRHTVSAMYLPRYERIKNSADEVVFCSEEYSRDCFKKRNEYLVDTSETVIAAYVSGNTRSGTAQTLRYAREKGREIILVK